MIEFHIRLAQEEDIRKVFDLANDPTVRNNSFTKSKIEFNDHQIWFQKKIKDPTCFFFIIEETNSENFIGYVRYENKNDEWTTSIAIHEKYRGKGIGSEILKNTIKIILKKIENPLIVAWVNENNIGSMKNFYNANFKKILEKEFENQKYFKLIYNRVGNELM